MIAAIKVSSYRIIPRVILGKRHLKNVLAGGRWPVKSLSTPTHVCECGCILDRDHKTAKNMLSRRLSTVGLTGNWG